MNYLIYVCTLILHRILLLARVCKRMRHTPLRPATFSKCIKYPLIQASTKTFLCPAEALRLAWTLLKLAIARVRRRALIGEIYIINYLHVTVLHLQTLLSRWNSHSLSIRVCINCLIWVFHNNYY